MKSDSFDSLASTVERLSVLLAAGVAPHNAWAYVGVDPAGLESESDDPAWRGLAAAWRVASEAGAPLAPTLSRFARSLRELGQNERDARTALAGPRATTRLVMVLPAVGMLFGLALGFDTLRVLFTTVPGLVCLAVGLALIALARAWNRRLLAHASVRDALPGLGLDLVAIAISGGSSMARALASVERAHERYRVPRHDATTIDEMLALSARAGVPAATLLRSAAEQARREARSAGERAAVTLGVTLMLPLGLCILPAFMLLGVTPMLLSVLSSTAGVFA